MKEYLTKEYLLLFHTLADAEETLTHLQATLISAQQQAEELYLERTDPVNKRVG